MKVLSMYTRMSPYLALVCVLGALLAGSARAVVPTSGTEVWFDANRITTNGVGTIDDAFSGSSANFSAYLNAWSDAGTVSGLTIHLLAGTYESTSTGSHTGTVIPPNSRLVGAGIANTTVKSSAVTTGGGSLQYYALRSGAGEYCEISDLSIDANYSASSVTNGALKGGVFSVDGTKRILLQRLKAIGFGAAASNQVLAVSLKVADTNGIGNFTVKDCYFEGPCLGGAGCYAAVIYGFLGTTNVSQWQGAYTNATLFVKNNRFLNLPRCFGVQGYIPNTVIDGNYFANLDSGFYFNIGNLTNLVVRNNVMNGVNYGVYANVTGSAANVEVEGNQIYLSDSFKRDSSVYPWGVTLTRTAPGIVNNNLITIIPYQVDGAFKTNWDGIKIGGVSSASAVQITDNSISQYLNNEFLSFHYTSCTGNKLEGYDILPNGFPMTFSLASSGSANVVIGAQDIGHGLRTLDVKLNSLSNTNQGIVLPLPSEVPGSRFTLAAYRNQLQNMPVPLSISGQPTNDFSQVQDPTSGGYFYINTPDTGNRFFNPETSRFFYVFNLFGGTNTAQRMVTVDLESNGYQWILHRY